MVGHTMEIQAAFNNGDPTGLHNGYSSRVTQLQIQAWSLYGDSTWVTQWRCKLIALEIQGRSKKYGHSIRRASHMAQWRFVPG